MRNRLNIHFLALAALLVRLAVAFASYLFYHPDEIFQYLEQAHRLTFDYGYLPWEYRYGTRSLDFTWFYLCILFLCKVLGIDDPAIYTVVTKVVFCVLSISLIYSVYNSRKRNCRCNSREISCGIHVFFGMNW